MHDTSGPTTCRCFLFGISLRTQAKNGCYPSWVMIPRTIGRCFPVSRGVGFKEAHCWCSWWVLPSWVDGYLDWDQDVARMRAGGSQDDECRCPQTNQRSTSTSKSPHAEQDRTSQDDKQGCKFAYIHVWDHAFFCGGECRGVTLNKDSKVWLTRRSSVLPEETWTNELHQFIWTCCQGVGRIHN